MKRVILIILVVVVVVVGIVWMRGRATAGAGAAGEKAAGEKPAAETSEETHTARDAEGNVIVKMNDEAQGNAGIKVAHPAPAQLAPEVKGYGRVLDPAPLTSLMTELALAQAAYPASSNELVRLKTLSGQGNASLRALQAAEAAALHDQLTIQSARDRLALAWGKPVADQTDPLGFIQSLTSLHAVMVRIDLPAGETLSAPPGQARIVALSGGSVEAGFLSAAASVDPQTQGQGFIFLIKTNAAGLRPGEAVTGYIKVPGEPVAAFVIPREAVVRTEGTGWVYVLNGGGDAFTRLAIPLDHPDAAGWLVTKGVTDTNYIVVTGAQTLLSEELKAAIKPD